MIINNKFSKYFALSLLLISNNATSDTRLNNRIDIDVDNQGTLTVNSGYLSNYIFRGQNISNESGSFKILERNTQAVDFDWVDVKEWDGFLPADLDFKLPVFNKVPTTIELSSYNYPNKQDIHEWKNSNITIKGANLGGLITDFPISYEDRIDAITLFLLNSLTVIEVSSELFKGGDKPNSNSVFQKIRPFAEKIANYQQTLQKAETVMSFFDVFVEQMIFMTQAAGLEEKDFEEYETLYSTYSYYKGFRALMTKLNAAIPSPNDDNRKLAKETIAKQYATLLSVSADNATDALISSASEKFATEFKNTDSKEKKLQLLELYTIAPLAQTLKAYKEYLELELKELKAKSASSQKVDELQQKINFLRNGYAILQLASLLNSSDDFLEKARTKPEEVVPVIYDIGFAVIAELATIENAETLAKGVFQNVTGVDGRTKPYAAIRKVSKAGGAYMKAFEKGADIGNKVIPLLWDVVLGENLLTTSIVDGQISSFGVPETQVLVEKNGQYYSLNSNKTNDFVKYIAADKDDELTFYANLYRPLLFDETRAPWELNHSFVPSSLYTVDIVSPNTHFQSVLCTRKIYFNVDHSIHRHRNDKLTIHSSECGEGTMYGGDGNYDDVDDLYHPQISYNPDDLPLVYSLQNKYNPKEHYIEAMNYIVDGNEEQQVSVSFDGLQHNHIQHLFKIVPLNGDDNISINTSEMNADNLGITLNLEQESIDNPDSIIEITIDWGDGNIISVNSISNLNHIYEEYGLYNIQITITRSSGQVTSISEPVDALSELGEQPTPDIERGLVAYYPFDGDANDYSLYGNIGYPSGNYIFVDGNNSTAISFDGNGYVSSEVTPLLSTQITMSAWINPRSQSYDNYTNGGIILNGGDYEIAITANTNTIRYALNEVTDTPSWTDTGISVPVHDWSHIVVTYDGAKVITYLNGSEVHRRAFTGSMPSTNYPLGIGGRFLSQAGSVPNNGWYSLFNGEIDEVKIYSRAITNDEVTMLYDLNTAKSTIPQNFRISKESGNTIVTWDSVYGAFGYMVHISEFSRFDEFPMYPSSGDPFQMVEVFENNIQISDFTDAGRVYITVEAMVYSPEIALSDELEVIMVNDIPSTTCPIEIATSGLTNFSNRTSAPKIQISGNVNMHYSYSNIDNQLDTYGYAVESHQMEMAVENFNVIGGPFSKTDEFPSKNLIKVQFLKHTHNNYGYIETEYSGFISMDLTLNKNGSAYQTNLTLRLNEYSIDELSYALLIDAFKSKDVSTFFDTFNRHLEDDSITRLDYIEGTNWQGYLTQFEVDAERCD